MATTKTLGTDHARISPSASILDWQLIVKVEHYRLKQDSIKHPVELKEDSPPYRTGGNL